MGFITADMNINNSLEKVGLIPDVIENHISSSILLQIDYNHENDVALGNNLTPQQTNHQPKVTFVVPPEEQNAYYTLVMTDPDAPSVQDKKFGPWRHWVITNISGSDVESSINAKENQHTPYIGPGPGENTGTHRYVFLLYKQEGKQEFKPMEHEQREQRRKFQVREFEAENKLELVTANYFCCPT